MIIRKEQSRKMLELAKPLMRWMNENLYPHTECVVSFTSVELKESISREISNEFIENKDRVLDH